MNTCYNWGKSGYLSLALFTWAKAKGVAKHILKLTLLVLSALLVESVVVETKQVGYWCNCTEMHLFLGQVGPYLCSFTLIATLTQPSI